MMTPPVDRPESVRFKGWEIRPIERILLVRGQAVPVGHRAFEVLLALVAGCGRTVSKDDLLSTAWPGLVVEENNVSVQIAALRKALGVGAIATVPGVGYRLSSIPDNGRPASGPAQPMSTAVDAVELVGRDDDIAALTTLLAESPLVSIVGTGGVGKTSLAQAVVAGAMPARPEDVHWIDLAPLKDAAQVGPTLAKALGIDLNGYVDPIHAVMAALASTRALVVLDNCEHLSAAVAAIVAGALRDARGVRWLATSQEPLRVAGEVVYRLQPLDMPRANASLQEAAQSGAIALLHKRAVAADRQFTLNAANLQLAIDLCRQLDGLPLAIEMAAARVATLGLETVHRQFDQRLRLLAGPRTGPQRQQTLRGTFDWSYRMLSSTEQKVFRRLHPFVDGFSVQMVGQVGRDIDDGSTDDDDWSTADALGALVDKSLVHRNAALPGRFFLFESARDYAGKRLAEAGERETIHRRHAHVVAAFFDRSAADLLRMRDDEWLAIYAPERHNTLAALAWASEAREPDLLAALVAALARMDLLAYSTAEIVRLTIPLDVLEAALPSLRSAACVELGWAHYIDGDRALGTELSLRALDDYRAAGDVAGIYRALGQLVRLHESRDGMMAEARRCWDEFRAIDDRDIPLRTRMTCAVFACPQFAPQYNTARRRELGEMADRAGFDMLAGACGAAVTDSLLIEGRYESVIEAARRFVDSAAAWPRARSLILGNHALALVRLGRTAEAVAPACTALRAYPNGYHVIATTFALAAAQEGRFVDAALLLGYADRGRRQRQARLDLAEIAALADTESVLAQVLETSRIDELLEAGAAMTQADVMRLATNADHEADTRD